MPKVKFSKNFNVRIDERRRVEFKAGREYDVSKEHADAAVKAKAGTIVDKAKA